MQKEKPIIVMTCYARSGGTLLNQCLAALPDVMIFSEISPSRVKGGVPHLRKQALDWYGIDLKSSDFTSCIRELHDHAHEGGKQLILRDWPVRCFEGVGKDNMDIPGKLVLQEHLPPEIPSTSFAFVRNTYDVFLSRPWGRGFLSRYLAYVSAVKESGMPIFRYEEFCKDPNRIMKSLCNTTGLKYAPEFVSDFTKQKQVTGDISMGNLSRGQSTSTISILPRRIPPLSQLPELLSCRGTLIKANDLLGYAAGYFSRPTAWPWRKKIQP